VGESVLTLAHSTLEDIAGEVGTPVYVYDADAIRASYERLTRAFGTVPHKVFYSVKSNSNLAILHLMKELGAGADIVSGGELARTQAAGIPGSDVVFSGVGKTRPELQAAIDAKLCLINVESRGEAEAIGELAADFGSVVNCGIRVNPDVTTDTHPYTQTGEQGMKFGVPTDEVVPLARWIVEHPNLSLRGVGMHIGSQITNADNFRDGAEKLSVLVESVLEAGATEVAWIGVGGGLGIRYTDERPLPAEEFTAAVSILHQRFGFPLALEPGRFLVGNAGCVLTRCLYLKRSGNREFAIVDAGMNDLLRPSLYGAVHGIVTVTPVPDEKSSASRHQVVDVVGPICESGDFLGRQVQLSGCEPGALLAVLSAGAYGFTMSSNYNSRPRPVEVLVEGGCWRIVRERESVQDLLRGESIN